MSTNSFYNHTDGVPLSQSRLASAQIRNEFDLVADGFGRMPEAARLFTQSAGYVLDTGGANAFFLTAVPFVTAYLDGMAVLFKVANTVTGAATINVNGLGAKAVNRTDGTPLQSGDIYANQIVTLRFSAGTDTFQFFSSSTAAAAGAAQAAADSAGAASLSAIAAGGSAIAASSSASAAGASATNANNYQQSAYNFKEEARGYRDEAMGYAGGGVLTFNGASGAVIYTAPVPTVAGRTGNVVLVWGDIGSKPTTRAGYGITDAGFVLQSSAAQSSFGTSGVNESWVLTNAASSFFTLPGSPTDGQRERVVFTNGRNDNKVYVSGSALLYVGTSVIGPGSEYLNLDLVPHLIREFVYYSSLGWEMA